MSYGEERGSKDERGGEGKIIKQLLDECTHLNLLLTKARNTHTFITHSHTYSETHF